MVSASNNCCVAVNVGKLRIVYDLRRMFRCFGRRKKLGLGHYGAVVVDIYERWVEQQVECRNILSFLSVIPSRFERVAGFLRCFALCEPRTEFLPHPRCPKNVDLSSTLF